MSRKNFQGFAIVLYDESDSDKDKLKKFYSVFSIYPYAMSPWHTRDIDSSGKTKKKHCHILFPSITGLKSLLEKKLSCYVEYVYDFVGYYHYLYHWDVKTNWFLPKKAQYWKADVNVSDSFYEFCDEHNFDLSMSSFKPVSAPVDILPKVISFLSNFTEYSEVLECIIQDGFDKDIRKYIMDNNYVVTSYITSNRHRLERVENARQAARLKDKDVADLNEILVDENQKLRKELETLKKLENVEFLKSSPFNQFDFFDKYVNK